MVISSFQENLNNSRVTLEPCRTTTSSFGSTSNCVSWINTPKIGLWIKLCFIGQRPRKRIPSEGEDKMEPSSNGGTGLVQKFDGRWIFY